LNAWPCVSFVTSPTGYPVSILKTLGGGWQKGKLRIRVVVEFKPEQPPKSEPKQHPKFEAEQDFDDGSWPAPDPDA
jgi:KGK domain